MNQLGHQGGNPNITEGRDLPWLQDVDADQDGASDVWLTSWPYAYRDVVILDAENRVVEAYNLTTNDLRVQEKYDELRQLFLDAAGVDEIVPLENDVAELPPGGVADVLALRNDPVSDGVDWMLQSIEQPEQGTAELVTIHYPTDLKPGDWPAPLLVVSEVRPGQSIELFNAAYEPLNLEDVESQLVVGSARRSVADLGSGLIVAARGYVQLDWPAEFAGSAEGGELLLYAQPGNDISDPELVADFVSWGTPIAGSRTQLAQAADRWSGSPAPPLAQGSIHRLVGTFGLSADDYDTQAGETPATSLDGAMNEVQVLRYTAPDGFSGEVTIHYMAGNANGASGKASVTVRVQSSAHPWRNAEDELDVDANGVRAPNDALLVINLLNRGLQGALPMSRTGLLATLPFVDTNGNDSIEPADLLRIINGLNGTSGSSAEGEAPGTAAATALPWHGEVLPAPIDRAAAGIAVNAPDNGRQPGPQSSPLSRQRLALEPQTGIAASERSEATAASRPDHEIPTEPNLLEEPLLAERVDAVWTEMDGEVG